MQEAWLNIGLAFLEGFALIISPCILPILPIVLSGSLTGNRSRPFGIVTGFILTFTLVTLFSKVFIEYAHIDPGLLRNFSFVILFLLGIVMLSKTLTDKFSLITQRLANTGSSWQMANDPRRGLVGGLIFGGLIGLVWTPCAGPILAAVIVQVVLQKTSLSSSLVVLAFAIGAGTPMLLIALLGRRVMTKFQFFRAHAEFIRRLLGLIIIFMVVYLAFFYDMAAAAVGIEKTSMRPANALIDGLSQPYSAPPISGDAWINSSPLTWPDLKNKVVLVDFWTYSCINCLRTLPYLKAWYANYHDQGFEIIGVHTPEFAFEHDLSNVQTAVKQLGIHYPVALDNQFSTWRQFHNQYWPAHYLVDKNGVVVYQHFGEGDYAITENNIRFLLGLKKISGKAETETPSALTPETYLGYARADSFASPESASFAQIATYTFPLDLKQNQWALKGKWKIAAEKIVSGEANAAIRIHFVARHVYIVMGVTSLPVTLTVSFNGKPLPANISGHDINKSQIQVTEHRLYAALDLPTSSEGLLEIVSDQPGVEMYTFTFG